MEKTLFTEIFASKFREYYPGTEITISGELELKYTGTDGQEYISFLDNAYREYSQNPEAAEEIIARYTASYYKLGNQSTDTQPTDKQNILPVIRSEAEMAYFRDNGIAEKMIFREYNEELYIFFVEDTETNLRYLFTDDLDEIGVSLEEIGELALENLRNSITSIERTGGDGVYGVAAGGIYEASLILWKELLSEENFPVDGDMVIGIPNRDLLFITGSNDTEGINKVREITMQYCAEGDHPVSPLLFRWDGEIFKKYTPTDVS